MILHILGEALLNAVLITGLVLIMMMLIECINIESNGSFFSGLGKSKVGGVLVGTILGLIPGCMGGFATVSLYTHGLLSFGALVAMMIASAGDESFIMLAMIPKDALWIFSLLFGVAVLVGILVDTFMKNDFRMHCDEHYELHSEDKEDSHDSKRHFGWKRVLMFIGVAVFITALATGHLEHEHGDVTSEVEAGFNLLSEDWMNIAFSILSIVVLFVLALGSDHFVEEHLWHHIVKKHLPTVFAWTFGVLVLMGFVLESVDISSWISDNTILMILLATVIGIIPESGPHLVFVTLYAAGVVPLPVLLASCISQDGHASLPLVAESRKSFLKAKIINCVVALVVGFAAMLIV